MSKQSIIGISIIGIITFLSYTLNSVQSITTKIGVNQEVEFIIGDDPFDKIMLVLMHKRCVNCHPSGDIPKQGEDSHLHYFDIARGSEGHGLSGYTCNSCHTNENNDFSGVPGAPHWALAPSEMAWEGKSRVEVARQMMDPERNGGKTAKEIEKHLTEDPLVLWAWDPGIDGEGNQREVPPIAKKDFIKAVKDWIEAGAVIPEI